MVFVRLTYQANIGDETTGDVICEKKRVFLVDEIEYTSHQFQTWDILQWFSAYYMVPLLAMDPPLPLPKKGYFDALEIKLYKNGQLSNSILAVEPSLEILSDGGFLVDSFHLEPKQPAEPPKKRRTKK